MIQLIKTLTTRRNLISVERMPHMVVQWQEQLLLEPGPVLPLGHLLVLWFLLLATLLVQPLVRGLVHQAVLLGASLLVKQQKTPPLKIHKIQPKHWLRQQQMAQLPMMEPAMKSRMQKNWLNMVQMPVNLMHIMHKLVIAQKLFEILENNCYRLVLKRRLLLRLSQRVLISLPMFQV